MQLHALPKITEKRLRRVGRGHGSGRNKTSGRGTKGQKARRDIPLNFEGGALSITKRLPFLRGKGKNKTLKKSFFGINVSRLNSLPAKTVVDSGVLVKHNIISARKAKNSNIKILGAGKLSVQLVIKLPVSAGAQKKIEKLGGAVEK
ncbi:MAG: 50S ribosomal protein L15 [Candidatus Levybacteria bacterium CG_4_10_14_0_2_um_filter_36_16]|nr:MAG: 50S ribosomal protein L15 [Candidatus Levybacteria bacterium CG2_30_37_29]PIR79307.1 MAG: 50S ribosomal protein L15 [Candidatus Levybacteria bacterium CG10_big_fil_rev_8_21_14_0_10_36_30]PIZ97114.1 MAG: 50S ribosomal protein L15 [Candidatus Levybacteria bacterium CG_4_10_14_0_2_um_filter_36_16]PJA90215.1 MAG: 50S ribosomal protein L15 [Candidatus Levybacteria bacterium CG_4_9_14_3_um_filter_36_7]